MSNASTKTKVAWFLTGRVDASAAILPWRITGEHFRVGRRADAELTLPSDYVSKDHAEIYFRGDELWIRDLGSRNGTYVNGDALIDDAQLNDGDIVMFSNMAFRVCRGDGDTARATEQNEDGAVDQACALVQFDRLITQRAVLPVFQPLVSIGPRETVAYEVLGRSRLFGLTSPGTMFKAAAQFDMEGELSRVCRLVGVEYGAKLPSPGGLFLNTHPKELGSENLIDSLRLLRHMEPDLPMTLEVHEAAVTEVSMMAHLREGLRDLNIALAFDDFGAGRSRLLELVETRPDYVKFDMQLTSGIHEAPPQQQYLLKQLLEITAQLGITSVAEGIECDEECQVCEQLGFQLAQGFLFGRPEPVTRIMRHHAELAAIA